MLLYGKVRFFRWIGPIGVNLCWTNNFKFYKLFQILPTRLVTLTDFNNSGWYLIIKCCYCRYYDALFAQHTPLLPEEQSSHTKKVLERGNPVSDHNYALSSELVKPEYQECEKSDTNSQPPPPPTNVSMILSRLSTTIKIALQRSSRLSTLQWKCSVISSQVELSTMGIIIGCFGWRWILHTEARDYFLGLYCSQCSRFITWCI